MTTVHRAPSDLSVRASRGAAVTFGGQAARIVVQLAGITLLARLLSPADYGVTAMVLAFIGAGEILRDFGLSSAAIQARTISRGQRTNLFWVNVAIGAVLTGAAAGLAVPIAAFYGDDRLVAVTVVLSSTFLLNGFATQFRADLSRRFQFGRLAGLEVASQLLALGAALGLALGGWGYWAIVAQQVLQALLQAVALPVAARWWPGLPRRGDDIRPFVKFGGGIVGAQLLAYASRNVDSMVIGRQFGAQQLGYYNRAFQLMVLPLNQINAPSSRVALPTLSRLQDDPERYARFLGFGQVVLLNVVSAVLGYSIAVAPDLVDLALGAQWDPSVGLFQILAVAGFFQAASYATYWVFVSSGRTTSFFWYTVCTRPVVIGLIIAGGLWGTTGIAVAYALGNALLWPAGCLWLARRAPASMGRLFVNGLRTLLVHGAAALASWSVVQLLPDGAVLRLAVGLAVYLAALGAAVLVVAPYRRDVRDIVGARRFFRSARAARAGGAVPAGEAGES